MTPVQERDGAFRRKNMERDKGKPRKGGAKIERQPKTEAYNRNKRAAEKVALRRQDWDW